MHAKYVPKAIILEKAYAANGKVAYNATQTLNSAHHVKQGIILEALIYVAMTTIANHVNPILVLDAYSARTDIS